MLTSNIFDCCSLVAATEGTCGPVVIIFYIVGHNLISKICKDQRLRCEKNNQMYSSIDLSPHFSFILLLVYFSGY